MAAPDNYGAQVELLIRCLPTVASAPDFALKGGTAINLFLRDMPRLSVDIDLTYLPVSERDAALTDIHAQLATITEAIRRSVSGVNVQLVEGGAQVVLVDKSGARIKVEPSVVIRGSLVPPVSSELCSAAQDAYELFVEIQRLDSPDLHAGKLCAALDRQRPRDLFDVMHLQASGPTPDSIRQAFVAYLAGHRRPIAELLQPNRKPIEDLFANHFSGMPKEPVELAELEAAQTQLFEWAASALTDNERRFLLSIKQGEPDWSLLPFEGLDRWPAIQWKLHKCDRSSIAGTKQRSDDCETSSTSDLTSKDSVKPCRDFDIDPRSVGRQFRGFVSRREASARTILPRAAGEPGYIGIESQRGEFQPLYGG